MAVASLPGMRPLGLALALLVGVACGDDLSPTVPEDPSSGTAAGDAESGTTGAASSGAQDSESDGGSSAGTTPEGMGCDGTPLRAIDEDPAAPGPWPVGAATVQIEGITTEIWYPAVPGSEAGAPPVEYDIRLALPESEQDKISDADNPWQPCDCARDLPIDTEHGPYPAVFFIHGTAGFRTQSLPQMTHWASRGFVVIAMDHPGLWLRDLLGSICGGPNVGQSIGDDVRLAMAAARGEAPGLEAIQASIDPTRFAVVGHSAGGREAGNFGDDAQALIPMAAGGVAAGVALESTLVLGALEDSVVPYAQQVEGYEQSPAPKRLVGIDNQGHLAFSSLCSLRNASGDDLLTIANANGVCGANLAGALFQCDAEFLADPDTWEIVNFATSATLEETLHCAARDDAWAMIQRRYAAVAEVRED